MNYDDYLKSNAWKQLRDEIIVERGCCEMCGSGKELQLHHLTYDRVGNESPEDLQVLCRGCHEEIEGFPFDEVPNVEYNFS